MFVDNRPTARQLRKAKLVVVDGADQGQEFVIEKSRVYVGRAGVNDITLSDQSISSSHFELRAEEDGFLLRDMGSTNGTMISGCRVREIFLAPNVTFQAGNTTLKLVPGGEVVDIPLSDEDHFGGVIGRSVAMREIFAILKKIAPSELTCLIDGDTGTGKERVARAIHDRSRRKNKPYVVLDCSSIPRDLMESYVFGHEKGAFTGAVSQRVGAFEQAHGGTLFLDEIGELPIDLQPKLLRVLENAEFKRVGGNRVIRTDCRVLAATNRDLRQMVNEGTFREDLYFRLSIVNLNLPPLRGRTEDIVPLAEHFLETFAQQRPDLDPMRLSLDALDALGQYAWPGNVRELRNVVIRAANLATGPVIAREDLHLRGFSIGASSAPEPPPASTPTSDGVCSFEIDLEVEFKEAKQAVVESFEEAYLEELFELHEGNISRASRAAGLTRYHLRELLKKYDLKR